MNITLGVAIYFILWWTVLFAVLPWGVRSHREAGVTGEGIDPGAPVLPRLLIKALATTVVSTILFAVGYAIWRAGWIGIDSFPMPYNPIKL